MDLRPSSSDPRRAAVGRLLRGEGSGLDPRTAAPAPEVRFRVVDEVVELLETVAASAPVVLIVEDLHWADESSLVAVRAIVHQLHGMPLLFVATLRPAPRTRDLDVLLDGWVAAGARLIELLGLGAEEVGALVLAVLGRPSRADPRVDRREGGREPAVDRRAAALAVLGGMVASLRPARRGGCGRAARHLP